MVKEEETPVTSCCLTTCITCCGIGLMGGVAIYYVFGILYLINYYNECKDCSKSELWTYVLTALVTGFLRVGLINTDKKQNNSNADSTPICVMICVGLFELGLAIRGGSELWNKSCDSLINTNLWKFAVVTFCIQTTSAVLALVIVPCGIACFVKKITDLDTDRQSNV
jgi:UDP-N-acetylmuramyl pentapeptide phosphotransferase/UDP-N-acetylglucosamine-1-phosphate transferase